MRCRFITGFPASPSLNLPRNHNEVDLALLPRGLKVVTKANGKVKSQSKPKTKEKLKKHTADFS